MGVCHIRKHHTDCDAEWIRKDTAASSLKRLFNFMMKLYTSVGRQSNKLQFSTDRPFFRSALAVVS